MDMAHERDASSEEEVVAGELRRGPWTVEEDLLLVNYVATHGEGRWNSLARSAGIGKLRMNFCIIWSLVWMTRQSVISSCTSTLASWSARDASAVFTPRRGRVVQASELFAIANMETQIATSLPGA
jgi:hypothetical protein